MGLWNEPELWGKQALRERKPLSRGDTGEGGVGAFSGRKRLLDELEELVGDVGGVFDLLEFIRGDAADGGEELGCVGLPLLDCAHALGGIEEGELSLDVPCGVGFRSSRASSSE